MKEVGKQINLGIKAQSFVEYSVLIMCMIAAIVGIEILMKRSLQGKYRDAADQIGGQYAPKQARADMTLETNPINIESTPKSVWLKYPEGSSKAGDYIYDEFGLPVLGIETTTTFSETNMKSGKEEMDKFEGDLFE